jgi:hypothetical protein
VTGLSPRLLSSLFPYLFPSRTIPPEVLVATLLPFEAYPFISRPDFAGDHKPLVRERLGPPPSNPGHVAAALMSPDTRQTGGWFHGIGGQGSGSGEGLFAVVEIVSFRFTRHPAQNPEIWKALCPHCSVSEWGDCALIEKRRISGWVKRSSSRVCPSCLCLLRNRRSGFRARPQLEIALRLS